MTADERVKVVADFGFTERQARFLVTVMLHSGVCLLRHYTAFAGIVHGQKTRKFFAKLVRHGYATTYSCRHNRGRVYHVQHKPLYRAIGETDSRLRRPMSAARVLERLTLLDALLACPDVVWLATSEEKQIHLSSLAGISTDEATSERVSRPAGGAQDEMPIGIDLAGRWVFAYVVTGDQLEDFHRFLQRRVAVLSVLPAWTLRIVFPMSHQWLRKQYEESARQELAKPWPELIKRLKPYFEQRRQRELGRTPIDDPEKYAEEHFGFHSTRYAVSPMVVLRCTQKLLQRLKQVDDLPPAESTTRLGDWYGNVLQIGRRQMLLFISERSRLPVIIPIRETKRLATIFPDAVCGMLTIAGVSAADIGEERSRMVEVAFGQTKNRSLLGTMNDFAFMAQSGYLRPGLSFRPVAAFFHTS